MLKYMLIALSLFATPAVAQELDANQILPLGQYVWQDDETIPGDVHLRVNISTQMAYVFRGDVVIGETSISTGRPGHPTPIGAFRITAKALDHVSTLYKAHMPYMERLTDDGVALHAGSVRTASHGCVHLPAEFAQMLYGITQTGDVVEIIDETPSPIDDIVASIN